MKIPVPMICLLASLPAGLACGPTGGASVSALATATPPDPPTAEALLSTVHLSDLSLAPDGGAALLTSNASGQPRPVVVDLDSGEARPVVGGTGGTLRAVDWFPDGRRLLLSGDDQGDELTHLFVADTDGSVRDLTPGAQRRAIFLDWSADGRSMFISDNQRDPGYADVYRLDASHFTRELLFRDTVGLQFGAISGDGRRTALLLPSGQTGGRIFTYDVREGRLTELPGQPDDAAAVPRAFSPDGASLYVTSNEDSDFARLERVDLDDGRRDVLFAPDWDVADARLVPGGRRLLVMVNEDARLKPYLVATDGSEAHAVPVEPVMSVREARVSGDGRRLAYLGSTGRTPTNLYVRKLSPRSDAEPAPTDASRLLLSGLPASLDPAMFVEPEIVRFPGLDSLPIPAILYRPHAASAERPAPVVLWAHGGPGGQAQIGFSPLIHYLVAYGYGVLEVNNRGSEGYGKRFWRLDDRRHGDADLDDYVAAKRWLGSLGWADSSRVAIAGSSYGGFLVLAALAFRPGTFDAGVDLYGISNWVRTIENMPPWFEPFRPALERELGPFDDLDAFRAKSPVFHADRIEEPLIVLQGANDPRVLRSESDEIVAALRERGVPVRYVLFEDEGHGFVKRENRVEAYRAIREFLDEHLAAEFPVSGVRAQFERLVGDWDIRQWRMDSSGTFPTEPSPAHWSFSYVLNGHAIQDFWVEPPPGEALADGEVRQYGTSFRMYDAERDRWNIVWTSSDDPRLITYTATREGEELVMVGDHEGERPSRIVYFDIREDSFRWRLEFETTDGWLTVSRIEGTRRR